LDKNLVDYLSGFITSRRNHLFDPVLTNRTRYITIALEDIYQSNNASAVLRTCDCFGIQDVHVIENNNEYDLNSEVTMGSEKWLNLIKYNKFKNNSGSALKAIKKKGYRIVATTPHLKSTLLPDFDVSKGKCAIFLGTELTGLSKTILDSADEYLKIPMFGFTESYNISVSAALILQSMVQKLHNSDINWQLTKSEKNGIKLEWLRRTIKKVELIEQNYLDNCL
jgi:tRNA (guanosine-2'-O-)-methyltransferase